MTVNNTLLNHFCTQLDEQNHGELTSLPSREAAAYFADAMFDFLFGAIGQQAIPAADRYAELMAEFTQLLQPLANHGVSMTRIESRPSRRKNWDYVFFIDLDGHAEESPAREALAELQERSSLFRILGAYPKAVG